MASVPRGVLVGLAAVAAIVLPIKVLTELFYLRIIPSEIGISYPVARGDTWSFREGCGAAVYRMDSATVKALGETGIEFFSSVRHSRKSADPYYTFGPWRPTPQAEFVGDDQTLLSPGLECAELGRSLQEQIEQVSREPGSYYTYGQEKVILVSPKLRLVVLSYNG